MNDEEIYDPMTGMKLWPADEKEKREWVGLTDEDIQEMHYQIKVKLIGAYRTEDIYRAVEAKLKEKNT